MGTSRIGWLVYAILIPLNFLLISFVVSQLFTWFVMPVSLVQAMGINVIWTFYRMRGVKFVKEVLIKTSFFDTIVNSMIQSTVALGIGFTLSLFL